MAFDEGLAQRIRDILQDEEGIAEKKMFGGLSFLKHGNMSVGIVKDDLCVRCGDQNYQEYLAAPEARVMDFTKRPMKGWLFVDGGALADDACLNTWVERGLAHAKSLPPK